MALGSGTAKYLEHCRLFLLSYAFLLRLPSEGLPITWEEGSNALSLERGYLILVLARRKNKPEGSRLVRGCWCGECSATCPVHALTPWLTSLPKGDKVFPNATAVSALTTLREMLEELHIKDAWSYRTHDLRRGHATDLQLPLDLHPSSFAIMIFPFHL